MKIRFEIKSKKEKYEHFEIAFHNKTHTFSYILEYCFYYYMIII